MPYFTESVEHCEVFYEGWVYSERYELIDNTMVLTIINSLNTVMMINYLS